jgi:hypothetical protein
MKGLIKQNGTVTTTEEFFRIKKIAQELYAQKK